MACATQGRSLSRVPFIDVINHAVRAIKLAERSSLSLSRMFLAQAREARGRCRSENAGRTDRTFKQIPRLAAALFNPPASARPHPSRTPDRSTPGFHSRVQVSIRFPPRSRHASLRIPIFLICPFCPSPFGRLKRFSRMLWRKRRKTDETLDSQIIESNSGGDSFSPSHAALGPLFSVRPLLCPLRNSILPYLRLSLSLSLILNGNPRRATWTESQIRIFEVSFVATARHRARVLL